MIYEVGNECLEIENEFAYLGTTIKKRMLHFKETNKKTKNKIKLMKNKTIINVGKKIELKGDINKTDIYPILNSSISKLLNNKSNVYIHSAVISKNYKGILILGDFNSGKTKLSYKAFENGFEINSADQTWIDIEDEKLYMKLGSKYLKYEDKEGFIDDKYLSKKINIIKIIILNGSCANGEYVENFIIKKEYKIKNLFRFCNWYSVIPLFTEFKYLYNNDRNILDFLRMVCGLDMPISKVRGDNSKIINEIKKLV
ncbi:MAG: hypothetical protein ABF289_03795 [Clostridiales bacterium]